MITPTNERHQLSFGEFEVDLATGELHKRGRLVPLQDQPFRLLSLLLERPGNLVTREEVRKRLWTESTFVDFDEGIDTALKKLRRALGDLAQNPIFIQTVPRRGYRFIASVTGNGWTTPDPSEATELTAANTTPAAVAPLNGTKIQTSENGSARSAARSLKLLAGVIAGTVLVAITVFVYQYSFPARQPELKVRQLTNNSVEFPVTTAAISPDGKYLAYTDRAGIHLRLVATGETSTISPPEALRGEKVEWEVVSHGWFPDSSKFLANTHPAALDPDRWSSDTAGIWSLSVLGGPPRKLHDHAVAYSVSPDGSSISFGTKRGRFGEREIWLMGPAGEKTRKLYETGEDSSIARLIWSPDGQRAIYVLTDQSRETYLSRALAGGPPLQVFSTADSKKITDASWLSDGRLIYSAGPSGSLSDSCNLWATQLDPRTGIPSAQPRRLTNWAGFCIRNISATKDVKRVAFQEWVSHSATYISNLEAGGRALRNTKRFNLEDNDDAVADWTPDSSTVIVVQNREDHYMLYQQSLNHGTPVTITTSPAGRLLESAQISPDGSWIILQVYDIAGGPSALTPIMRVPFAGGAPELLLSVPAGSGFNCARPTSNLCILAEPSVDRKQLIVRVFDPLEGRRGKELARFDFDSPGKDNYWPLCALSPDSTRLAVSLTPEGPIKILSLNSGSAQTIPVKGLDNVRLLGWNGKGNGLFVVSGVKGGTVLQYVDRFGNSRVLWKCSGGRQCDFSPSPDGRQLAILDRQLSANMWTIENF